MQAAVINVCFHFCWPVQLAFSGLVREVLFVDILENHAFRLLDQEGLEGRFKL